MNTEWGTQMAARLAELRKQAPTGQTMEPYVADVVRRATAGMGSGKVVVRSQGNQVRVSASGPAAGRVRREVARSRDDIARQLREDLQRKISR